MIRGLHGVLKRLAGAVVAAAALGTAPAWAVPVTYDITGSFVDNGTPSTFDATLTFDPSAAPSLVGDDFGPYADWNLTSASVTFSNYSGFFNTNYAIYEQYTSSFTGANEFFAFGPYSDSVFLINMQPIFADVSTAVVSGVDAGGSEFFDAHSISQTISNLQITVAVPEPASVTLFGLGAAGLLALRRRRKGRSSAGLSAA